MDKSIENEGKSHESKSIANENVSHESQGLASLPPPPLNLGPVQQKPKNQEEAEHSEVETGGKSFASSGNLPPNDQPFQLKSVSEDGGLPANLKSGIEGLSGFNMNDVSVHYNSDKPAQLNAHAYAQGSDIHLGPGQEKHLPHEAWHVVQQKQGRVQSTIQQKGIGINDDKQLEHEADVMGQKAVVAADSPAQGVHQRKAASAETLQLKTTNVTLPEQLGPRQEGSVAVRGEGDAHAFSPNDVNQGSIGDCYFLASLVAIANTNPGLLQQAITENSDGTYSVRLYQKKERRVLFWKRQVFQPVIIKLFPTFPVAAAGHDAANPDAADNPPHAHGGDQSANGNTELWVRLFEKAYAILMGSYQAIGNGGFGANALETLTGRPYEEQVLSDDTKERIIEMVEDGIPVEVATNSRSWDSMSRENKRFARQNSIVAGHSYAVIAANSSSITVRNPWGTGARNAEPTLTWAQFDAMFWQFSNRQ